MKLHLRRFMFLAFFLVLATVCCISARAQQTESSSGQGSDERCTNPPCSYGKPHAPSYFGFYDSSSPGFPDETQNTATFANSVWMGCNSPGECDARLQEAKFFNMHVLIELGQFCGQISNINVWTASWAAYLPTFKKYVGSTPSTSTLVAVTPCDEMFGSAWTPGNNAAATISQLDAVASVIKQDLPSVKVPLILMGAFPFTYFQHGQNIVPANVDWVGIDIYGCYNPCPTYSDQYTTIDEPYNWYVQTLEANLSANQQVMLLPGSAISVSSSYDQFESTESSTTGWQDYVAGQSSGVIENIVQEVSGDTDIVAVFGYQYNSYFQSGNLSVAGYGIYVGANDPTMAPIMHDFVYWGNAIIGRTYYSEPPIPAGTIPVGEPVELVNGNSAKCLDITGVSVTPLTSMQQYQCLGAGQLNQMWKLYEWSPLTNPGQYQIISVSNNLYYPSQCLELQNGNGANGTTVQQNTCSQAGTSSKQLWNLVPSGSGFQVVSAATNTCLSVYGNGTGNGVQVYSYQCIGATSQIWVPTAPALLPAGTAASNPFF